MVDTLLLTGSPSERGAALGKAAGEYFVEAAEQFKRRKTDVEGWSTAARELSRMLMLFAPDWIAEAQALAGQAAGVGTACFLAQNTSVYGWDAWNDEATATPSACLSATAAGHSCVGSRVLLLTNLEGGPERPRLVSRASSPGALAFVGLSCACDLGVSAFINEAGLSGCVQPGPALKELGHGLRPTLALRAIAERCLTVEQALQKLSDLQDHFGLACVPRGSLFLLADAEGNTALVETTTRRRTEKRQHEGLWTVEDRFQLPDSPDGPKHRRSARQQRLHETLCMTAAAWPRLITAARLGPLPEQGDGERAGICREGVFASFAAVVGGRSTIAWAAVSLGAPNAAPPLVVFPGCGVPLPAVHGAVSACALSLQQQVPTNKRLEALVTADDRLVHLLLTLEKSTPVPGELDNLIQQNYADALDFFDSTLLSAMDEQTLADNELPQQA
jgi:hypothetical protein